MHVPGIPRLALVAMIVAAVALFAFGATSAVGLLTQRTQTETRTLAAARTIVVDTDTGDVRIVGADRTDVRLTTKEKRSVWGGAHVKVTGDAGLLRLDSSCDSVPIVDDPCGVSAILEVPRDADVRVATATGDLRASGVQGTLRLDADTGDVHVEGPSPDVVARTSTGDVRVETGRPGTVDAQADTGDIHISVPDLTYAVDAETGTGDETVDVRRDDASPRRLRAHTDTGDVHLEPDG